MEKITREEVVRALAFLDNERVQQKKFWREAYNETQPGGIGACILVLRRLAEQWLTEHPDPGELVLSYCVMTKCVGKEDFMAPRAGNCPRCGAPAFHRSTS